MDGKAVAAGASLAGQKPGQDVVMLASKWR